MREDSTFCRPWAPCCSTTTGNLSLGLRRPVFYLPSFLPFFKTDLLRAMLTQPLEDSSGYFLGNGAASYPSWTGARGKSMDQEAPRPPGQGPALPAQPSPGPASEMESRSRPSLPPSSVKVSRSELRAVNEEEMFKKSQENQIITFVRM